MNEKKLFSSIEVQSSDEISVLHLREEEDFLNAFISIAQRAMDDYHSDKKKERKVMPVLKTKGDCI